MAGQLQLHALFPCAVATVQLTLEPLHLAQQLQTLFMLRGQCEGNPADGCAWTGDLNGVWQLHHHADFSDLAAVVTQQAWDYLVAVGFESNRVALHLQRCWPVLSDWDQVVGRHCHPNAHLSAVIYLTGRGSGEDGVLRIYDPFHANEIVPGLSVGHGGPIVENHPFNRQYWDLAPQPGLLVLFPSRLEHGVLPNYAAEELRCSISFDFVLTASSQNNQAEYLAPHPSSWFEAHQR